MRVLVRHTFLIMFVWLMLAGICLGKQVYLKDGGIIDSQSAWRQGNKVFVKVNRDIVADFNLNEIDLHRTFPKKRSSSGHTRRKVIADKTDTAAVQAPLPVAPPPAATTAAPPKPAVPPVATAAAAPAAKVPAQPVAPPAVAAAPASLPDKAGMMKKAVEMQQNAIPQKGVAAQLMGGFSIFILLLFLAVGALIIAGQWIIFTKAGQAGWKSLVPFYNMYILMIISGKPGWWMFLLLIPLVGAVIFLLAMLSLAKKFGKKELFGVGLFLLPMIFFPLLAFGSAEYEG